MLISLLSYSLKLLTKLLANRLQVILKVVHANQYGFIRGRTIQDCLAWAFQFLHICHKSKREIVLLKLDFEKAFDKIEHAVILEVLKHKGFSETWVSWIKAIFTSGFSSIVLNGIPDRICRKYVQHLYLQIILLKNLIQISI
jgi:retron-type reverse transcriptase